MIYEILYIVPSRFSETEIEGVTKQVQEVLQKSEAKIERVENLGKLKLAYPIKKERHGTYVLTYITVAPEKLSKIDLDLRLTDEVLRHVIVKRPEGIPTVAFQMDEYEAPITAEGKRIHKKGKMEVATARKVVAQPTETISEEDLEKKLDSILDDSSENV